MPSFLSNLAGRIVNASPTANFSRIVLTGAVFDSLSVISLPNLITFDNVLQVSPITPVAASGLFVRLTLTSNAVYTLNVPSGTVPTGARLQVMVRNTIGGAAGVMTFAAGYHLAGAWVQPLNNNSRSIEFQFDGALWIEVNRNAADVPV